MRVPKMDDLNPSSCFGKCRRLRLDGTRFERDDVCLSLAIFAFFGKQVPPMHTERCFGGYIIIIRVDSLLLVAVALSYESTKYSDVTGD